MEYLSRGITLRRMTKNAYSNNYKELQILLKKIRVDKGLKQSDLANQLGRTQSYVSKYESGELQLDILELRNICSLLGLSLADFVMHLEERIS